MPGLEWRPEGTWHTAAPPCDPPRWFAGCRPSSGWNATLETPPGGPDSSGWLPPLPQWQQQWWGALKGLGLWPGRLGKPLSRLSAQAAKRAKCRAPPEAAACLGPRAVAGTGSERCDRHARGVPPQRSSAPRTPGGGSAPMPPAVPEEPLRVDGRKARFRPSSHREPVSAAGLRLQRGPQPACPLGWPLSGWRAPSLLTCGTFSSRC